MDPADFTLGMDHELALEKGLGINSANLSSKAAAKVFTHILDLMPDVNINKLHNRSISVFTEYASEAHNNPYFGVGVAYTGIKGTL